MNHWSVLSLTFRWPHQGLIVGYELFEPDERDEFYTFRLHFLLFSISFEWGTDNNPYI